MDIKKEVFGKTQDEQPVDAYTLTNKNGMKVQFLNYGGTITQVRAPNRNGALQDIVLGYENLPGILADTYYMGALLGRYANRIGRGEFSLDGKKYQLACNNNGNHLHGGIQGFNKRIFDVEAIKRWKTSSLKLTHLSKDGEEGYPGNLNVTIYYTLADTNEFSIEYEATTDQCTVINLSNHMYFNLSGDFDKDILLHELQAHQAIVHLLKTRAGKFNHFDFNARARQVVHQQRDDIFRRIVMIKCGMDQVDADNAKRFLLADVLLFEHPHMDDDLRRFFAWLRLEFHAQPAVTVLLMRKTARGDRVGEHKKSALVAARLVEPLQEQIELVIEHGLEAFAADITVGRAVNRIADGHVVGGNGFGDGARSAADVKKPAGDFLAGADLGKGAVFLRVEIDLRRLLAGVLFLIGHISLQGAY